MKNQTIQPKVITWDHREQINISELNGFLKDYGISVFEIETNSDEFAIVLGGNEMSAELAASEYRDYCYYDLK